MGIPLSSPELPLPSQPTLAPETGAVIDLHPREDEGLFLNGEGVIFIKYEVSGGHKTDDPLRRHDLITVEENDDYRHVMWVTDPVEASDDPLIIIAQPGLGETIEGGVGFEFHKALARYLPDATIVSHATNGIGHHGQHLSNLELPGHTMDDMAEHNLAFYQKHLPGRRIVLLGNSMGTVIDNRLILRNLDEAQPLQIAGVVNLASALVPPGKVPVDMMLRFPLEIAIDFPLEVFGRTKFHHFLGLASMLGHSGMRWDDGRVIGREAVDLLHGTRKKDIETATKNHPTATIVGTGCGIGEVAMWLEMEKQVENLDVYPINRRRHAIAFKSFDAARKSASTIKNMDLAV